MLRGIRREIGPLKFCCVNFEGQKQPDTPNFSNTPLSPGDHHEKKSCFSIRRF